MADISPSMRDLLALTLVPGLGPRLTAALLRHFGSAAAVRLAGADALRRVPHIGEKLAQQFAEAMRTIDVATELERIARHHVHLRALGTAEYPPALATIPDPPPMLYCRGTITEADRLAIGIVGSRKCSTYGRTMAATIAAGLVRAGYTVVSGLALGIDGAAHHGAIQAGGRTIAVLAGGLSSIYPPQHVDLAAAVEANGCLVSETPMALPPQAGMFHARNRIISGMVRAVVIIEAGEQSGALITASHAAEQGREVFVVPANADSAFSKGSLRLLRDGARLVRGAADILDDLNDIAPIVESSPVIVAESKPTEPSPKSPPPALDPSQRRIWDLLSDGPRHVDDLSAELQLPIAPLTGMLMTLEIKKAVRRLPGNLYERA